MIEFSGRCSPVSVNVLNAFSVWRFSHNLAPIFFMFPVVSALLVLVFMKLLNCKMLSNTSLYILHCVLYIK